MLFISTRRIRRRPSVDGSGTLRHSPPRPDVDPACDLERRRPVEDAQQLSSLFLKLRPSGPTSLRQGVHTCCLLFEPEEGEEGKFSSKAGRIYQGTIWSRAFPAGTRSEDQRIVLLLTGLLGFPRPLEAVCVLPGSCRAVHATYRAGTQPPAGSFPPSASREGKEN